MMINLDFPLFCILFPLLLVGTGYLAGEWVPCSARTVIVAFYVFAGFYMESGLAVFLGYAVCYVLGDLAGLSTRAERKSETFRQQSHIDWIVLLLGIAVMVPLRLLGLA